MKADLRKIPRLRRFAIAFFILVSLFGAFGFLAGPPIARSVLVKTLSQQLHRPVTVGDIAINPYQLTARVADLRVGDGAGGETAGFDELFVNLNIASLFHAAPVVDEFRLSGPRIQLIQETPGRYNVSDLLDEWLKPSDAPPAHFSVNNIQISGGRIVFEDRPVGKQHAVTEINLSLPFVSNLPHHAQVFTEPAFSAHINGAPLVLAGKSRPFAETHESELQLDINGFELSRYLDYAPTPLPFTATGGQIDADIKLVFRQAPKTPGVLDLSGNIQLHDLHLLDTDKQPLLNLARMEVPLTGIAPLTAHYRIGAIGIDGLEAFVSVDGGGSLNWLTIADRLAGGKPARDKNAGGQATTPPEWSVDGLRLSQSAIHWRDESHPRPLLAHVSGIDMTLGKLDGGLAAPIAVDLAFAVDAAPHASLAHFELQGGQVDLPRQQLNIATVVVRGLKLAATRAADGRIAGLLAPQLKARHDGAQTDQAIAAAKSMPAQPPWGAAIGHFELVDAGLRLADQAVSPPTNHMLEIGKLALDKFSTAPRQPSNLELQAKLNKKGSVQANGTVQMAPMAAKLKVDLRGIELLPLQPYFGDHLNLTITKGQISGSGEVALNQGEDGSFGGGYQGQLTVGNFHSVDKTNQADFLTWKSFYLGKLNVAAQPPSLTIGNVALTDFFARLIVSADGKLNLLQIVKKDEPAGAAITTATPAATGAAPSPAPSASSTSPPPPIRIDQVTLQGGTVSITDNFIKPNYSANLAEIGGRITGLSSAADSTADLDLRGAYDGAPVTIAGKLNPLATTPSLDIKAEVRGVELTALSAYSSKYAGYAIDKGKLSLFLGYKIADAKLQADNRIFLDQLTFGEKVDSPDATKLPVTLAVSLLQNRRGEIDINLPISGSLDDPEFSVGGIVIQVIVNLLTKAITAPFALLGSLMGGGDEMSHVEFADGRALLAPAALKRLEALAKALDDRPGLKLEVTGRIDPEKDAEGLRQAALQTKVKAQKLAQLVKEGKEAGAVDEMSIDDKDYLPLLEQAYKQEKFPKPRNFIGLAKSLPREEMEKLMVANVQVGNEELRNLANQRAKGVADWLSTAGKIPRERIFLLPPKLAADGGGPKDAPLGRVEFSLK